MPDFDLFFMLVGFSVVLPTVLFLIIFCVAYVGGQLLRFVNNSLTERLIKTHGLIKLQSLYANRRYLTFVWDKEKHKKGTGNDTEDSI